MSKGPGRIERAIRALFDTHPDEAFTTDEVCLACYPDLKLWTIERKHQVAVMRAANKVLTSDPDWRSIPPGYDRRALIFCNKASVPSMIMRHHLRWSLHARAVEQTRELLDQAEPPHYQRKWRDDAARSVRAHLAIRAADPAEAMRLRAEHQSEGAKELARLGQTIRATLAGRPAYVLPTGNGAQSATLTALAHRLRVLMVQNDPDAVRAGLADIADALDAMGCRTPTK